VQKLENGEEKWQQEIFQLKQNNYLLEEEKKNAEFQYNQVIFFNGKVK